MSHTVTITLEDEAYRLLQQHFGDDQLDQVILRLLQPYVAITAALDAGYAAMAADTEREAEAREWIEDGIDDGFEDWDDDWSWLKPR